MRTTITIRGRHTQDGNRYEATTGLRVAVPRAGLPAAYRVIGGPVFGTIIRTEGDWRSPKVVVQVDADVNGRHPVLTVPASRAVVAEHADRHHRTHSGDVIVDEGPDNPWARRDGEPVWVMEFSASMGTIGQANDLLRQAAPRGTMALTATEAGRLGFETVGVWDDIHRAEVLLRNRGERVYLTRR